MHIVYNLLLEYNRYIKGYRTKARRHVKSVDSIEPTHPGAENHKKPTLASY